MPKVYTKAGDQGETRMRDGTKTDKASCQSEAIGDLDELNSNIGLCISFMQVSKKIIDYQLVAEANYLEKVQELLFRVGTIMASPSKNESTEKVFDINEELTTEMENRIDNLTMVLSPLKNFIAPRGNTVSSQLHVTRAVCRRTERHMKSLINETNNVYIQTNCSAFMNRLSDYLFTLARYVNHVYMTPDFLIKN